MASSSTLSGVILRVNATVDRKRRNMKETRGRNEGVVDSSVSDPLSTVEPIHCGMGITISPLVGEQEGVSNGTFS